jgi:hypothetical protein
VTWRRDGIVGTPVGQETGAATAEPLGGLQAILPQGRVHVVVTSRSEVQAFDIEIPQRFADSPFASYLVREGGAVEDAGSGPSGG